LITTQNYLTTNINKYISQFAQFNQNNNLYIAYISTIYNQGILNNIIFLNQNSYNNSKNNHYNNNHNNKIDILKQEKLIETEYEKLGKLKKENPSKISENLKLFENYILLPIYNEINSNSNTPEISKLYSSVYLKYKEVINSVIKENNLEGTIVEPYGSIVNNFLTSDGDIDISIVPNNISKIGFRIYLEQIEKELVKQNLIQDNEEENDINLNNNSRIYISTRYARLSVVDLETNIYIDITVHNLLPIKNSKMIRLYSLFDQRFHILGIFLKHWVKINNIKGAPNKFLSSYALLLLIIHFLQDVVEPKILPMLQEIMPKEKNKDEYDYKYFYDDKEFNTNLYFEENFDKMKEYMNIINCGNENNSSVSELLVQFFEYYAYIYNSINSKHYLISIKHSDKNNVANNTEHIAYPLEDPFDVNHNPSSTLKLNTSQYSEFIFCMRKEINNILSGEYFK
jgi:DNA polymerase sigma